MRNSLIALLIMALMSIFIASCEAGGDADNKERQTNYDSYQSLQSKQPAETMDYSPTREGINKWMETWEEPGKLSYVYLLAANGQEIGYYVFKGLPISYCASLTPTDKIEDRGNNSVIVGSPSMDGVYYSGSQCNQYFGFDATTGSYLEFSTGSGINFLVYEQPLDKPDVEPLGFSTIKEAQAEEAKK